MKRLEAFLPSIPSFAKKSWPFFRSDSPPLSQEKEKNAIVQFNAVSVRNLKWIDGTPPSNIRFSLIVSKKKNSNPLKEVSTPRAPVLDGVISLAQKTDLEIPCYDTYPHYALYLTIHCYTLTQKTTEKGALVEEEHEIGVIEMMLQDLMEIAAEHIAFQQKTFEMDWWAPITHKGKGEVFCHFSVHIPSSMAVTVVENITSSEPPKHNIFQSSPEYKKWKEQETKKEKDHWIGNIRFKTLFQPPLHSRFSGSLTFQITGFDTIIHKTDRDVTNPDCKGLWKNDIGNVFVTVHYLETFHKTQTVLLKSHHKIVDNNNPKSENDPMESNTHEPYSCSFEWTKDSITKDSQNQNILHFVVPPFIETLDSNSFFHRIKISIWKRKQLSFGKILLGQHIMWMNEIQNDSAFELPMYENQTEREIEKNVGKLFAQKGFKAKYPVVFIPGFASSALTVEQGDELWKSERIWLSLNKLGGEKWRLFSEDMSRVSKTIFKTVSSISRSSMSIMPNFKLISSTSTSSSEEDEKEEIQIDTKEKDVKVMSDSPYKNDWFRHLSLQSDGYSDPPGIKVRSVDGVGGVSYLCPGMLTDALSYVMGPLIEQLREVGYSEEAGNLLAASYDWRIPGTLLEERDGYFSSLMKSIEKLYYANSNTPVAVICHSMGNRTFHIFLNWVKITGFNKLYKKSTSSLSTSSSPMTSTHSHHAQKVEKKEDELKDGQEWIDKFIYSFIAVGSPWLGAPKSLRGTISGERMGLELFLDETEAKIWGRTIGSTKGLWPIQFQNFFSDPSKQGFINIWNEEKQQYISTPLDQVFQHIECQDQMKQYQKYYLDSPYYGGTELNKEIIAENPPVKKLYNIYGTDLDTELSYLYIKKENDLMIHKVSSLKTPISCYTHHTLEDGIFYENSDTFQRIIHESTGLEGTGSGDGTVPYTSLCYYKKWTGKIEEIKADEIHHAEHRAILGNYLFHVKILQYVCEKGEISPPSNKNFFSHIVHKFL